MYRNNYHIDPRVKHVAHQMAMNEINAIRESAAAQIEKHRQRVAVCEQQLRQYKNQKNQLLSKLETAQFQIKDLLDHKKTLDHSVDRQELEGKLTEAQAELRDFELRAQAEIENNRMRTERITSQRFEMKKESLLRDFIGVMDNLELALRHSEGDSCAIREGVEATMRQWQQTLEQHGIEPVEAIGRPFDPNLHEAVTTVSQPNVEPDTVVQVEQSGYMLEGKLLRPARVIVAQ